MDFVSPAEAQRRGERKQQKGGVKMSMQFFSDYLDGYKKKHESKIGDIVKAGKFSREIDYGELQVKWDAIKAFFKLNADAYELFKQAATGLELKRITQLNSSSLFAFLFFHTVSKNNRVKITGFEDEFTNVMFEVSNTICENTLTDEYEGRRPDSHIDVVLYNENTALLLECKFSEYLEHYSSAPAKAARRAYEKFYKMLFVDNGGIDGLMMGADSKNNKVVTFKGTNDESCYFDGLKQTIAHFMGTQGILNSDNKHKELSLEGKKLHLAEVVFDFSKSNFLLDVDFRKAFDAYAKFHKLLCEKLTGLKDIIPNGRDVTVHSKLLSYQNDFELKLPHVFADLYQLSNRPGIKTN